MEGPKTSTVPVNSLDPVSIPEYSSLIIVVKLVLNDLNCFLQNDPARYGILVVNWLQIFILSILMVVFIAAV